MSIEPALLTFIDWGWSNMFVLDQEKVSYIEKIIRPIIIYGLLVFLFRILGKREIAQLNPVDFIVLLLVSNTVQNAIIGDDTSVTGGVIGVVSLLFVNRLVAKAKYKRAAFEALIEGTPRLLIENGKIDKKAIKQELLTKDDLEVIAHKEGYESIDDLDKCVLDPNGVFFVEGKVDTKDEKFRKDVLQKIEHLAEQMNDLRQLLQKS
jgi:uncharacterized membrane protein YcaP (DUF421 family)